ncbi:MAG TPA: hypothetical protein VFV78_11385 [Vicinamibacterales bacterium]|nr:hypothetical protein [Vicinamibacterales bacterium]
MPNRRRIGILLAGLSCFILGVRSEARSDTSVSAPSAVKADEAATHELLEGTRGRRETWAAAPALLIETTVMDYSKGDLSTGFVATDERLSDDEVAQLTADLTAALGVLTAETVASFQTVARETSPAGQIVKVLRPGQIVVGRFRGVQGKTGNIGYGGRMTRNGEITQGFVVLDAKFDRESSERALLRTHELGHALGFNHVQSRPSIMNARVGSTLTDFDRAAIRAAFGESAAAQPLVLGRRPLPLCSFSRRAGMEDGGGPVMPRLARIGR